MRTLNLLMRLRCLNFALLFACFLAGVPVFAQGTMPAVLMADIHFDPFHNPRLLPQLMGAPVDRWPAILDSGNGLKAEADLAMLEVACRSPRLDTDWDLLKKSLQAAHEAQPQPLFVTLGGDLLAHQFQCRFNKLVPGATTPQLAAFSAKTVAFVAMEMRLTFPRAPVYITLGNNDSGCADYRETAGSPFMQSAIHALAKAAVQAGSASAYGVLLAGASPEGDYSVALPAPLQRGRLLVLQDIFDAAWYGPCSDGGYTRVQEHEQMAWLRAELTDARAQRQQVWVMGHIPPGVDVYGSFAKYVFHPKEICSADDNMLLADNELADTLLDFADVVRLGLFAHTHMDEMRLLRRPAARGAHGAMMPAAAIPLKIVPSVTDYYGNHPAFLVAAVDPGTLLLKDWRTSVSPDNGGSNPPWPVTYRFREAYQLPDFSAASAAALADGFTADHDGKAPRSTFFRDHFYAGGNGVYALGLDLIWPAYACAVREYRQDAFHDCVCTAAPPGK